jgi:hypothetical protein
MNLPAIAKAYIASVDLEEKAQRESAGIVEELAIIRSDLHALLMDALREAHIPYADRADAARIAFEIVRGKLQLA